jgi:hypothetical protein
VGHGTRLPDRRGEAGARDLGRVRRDARTYYTRTSVQGYEAVIADTTYGLDRTSKPVMQLFIRTDDDRLYELRVDMPKGTPEEKEGTAVFKGARDRLRIGRE